MKYTGKVNGLQADWIIFDELEEIEKTHKKTKNKNKNKTGTVHNWLGKKFK